VYYLTEKSLYCRK